MNGVKAIGIYVPRLRISREEFQDALGKFDASGIEKKAVPNADEDTVTMAYEAAKNALSTSDVSPKEVDFLAFATTTPPTEEEDSTPRLREMLGLRPDVSLQFFTGSTRAGTRALTASISRLDAENALVVVADSPRSSPFSGIEHAGGAAGTAFVLGDSDGSTANVTEVCEHSSEYPGTRFRRRGEKNVESLDVTQYERNAYTESIEKAVSGLSGNVFDSIVLQSPDAKLPYRALSSLGYDSSKLETNVSRLGDLGAASVLHDLGRLVAGQAGRFLAVSYGSGAGADAVVVESSSPSSIPAEIDDKAEKFLSYSEYLRQRGEITAEEPEGGGAYVSAPSWKRSLDQRYRLVAGKCLACGGLNFPPEGACTDCHANSGYTEVELSRTGVVEACSRISQGGAPPEFVEFQSRTGDFGIAIVEFEGPDGGLASIPAQVIGSNDGIEVGDEVEATLRRIYTQEGVTRYGFKVRPR